MNKKMSAKGGCAYGAKAKTKKIPLCLAGCLILFSFVFVVSGTEAAKSKTLKDLIVKSTDGDDHTIKAVKDGHVYTINATNAKIKKSSKGSKTLDFDDIKNGDVLRVKGTVSDRDVTATEVRDLSTTSSAVMYGIVKEINSSTQTVKIETTDRGDLTVAILKSTSIKYDGKKRKFTDIKEDDKVLVTGTWSSSKDTITKTKKFYILVKEDYSKLDLPGENI
ncbi:MAG: DUF5666 domain-containing protein [Candidatus Moranbacteria bacterium]|nr:DUF5666 domain-containing protein [Candidatus Moranbacteria bacterium]